MRKGTKIQDEIDKNMDQSTLSIGRTEVLCNLLLRKAPSERVELRLFLCDGDCEPFELFLELQN